jgi:predicted CopG family antitoxin
MGGHKTLTISEEAYEKLVKIKRSGESFTQAILRLTRGKGNLLKHAGSWGNLDDAEVERVFKEVREAWKKGWHIESS